MTITSDSDELYNNITIEPNKISELSKNIKDSWTMNIERVLDKLRINCCQLSNFHKYKYQHCKSQIKWFRLPIITISSITTFASVGLQEYVKQETISVITSVLSLVVGIISGIEMFMKYQDKMETELTTHKEYYKLSVEIYKMISIDRAYRKVSGKDFLEEKFNEYQKIKSHSRPEEPSELVYDILADLDELFLYKRQSKNNNIGWTNKIEMAPPLYQKESTSLGVSYDRIRNPEKYYLREQSRKLENKTRITQKYIDQRWRERKANEKDKPSNILVAPQTQHNTSDDNNEPPVEKNKKHKSFVTRVTEYFSPEKNEFIDTDNDIEEHVSESSENTKAETSENTKDDLSTRNLRIQLDTIETYDNTNNKV